MTQQEVYDLIKRKPRLSTTEIAERLGWEKFKVCSIIRRMIDKEIKSVEPTEKEKEKLLLKYPSLKYAGNSKEVTNRIKVFMIIENGF